MLGAAAAVRLETERERARERYIYIYIYIMYMYISTYTVAVFRGAAARSKIQLAELCGSAGELEHDMRNQTSGSTL